MTCEREKFAADRRTAKTLIGIADEINSLRCLVDVAEMASETLDTDYGAPALRVAEHGQRSPPRRRSGRLATQDGGQRKCRVTLSPAGPC